jgi:glycine/D-amino acid oxidase-like deaminating enzyme
MAARENRAMHPFPLFLANPAEHAAPLPSETDIVIIGGGVVGVATALFARRNGLSVVLIEKGRIAAEQSSRNWGWIRAQGRDPAELPIMLEARGLWRDLAAQAGEDIGLAETGVLYLAESQKDLAGYEAWLEIARAHGLDTRLLSAAETATMLPQARKRWPGALWTASDMRAEPWVAVPALARLAAREGVAIRENCAARGLDISAGRVAGIVTEAGRISASAIVLAGGAWSSLFLRRHGIGIPQLAVRSTAVRAKAAAPFAGQAVDGDLGWRPRADGGLTLALGSAHDFFIGPDAFRQFFTWLPTVKATFSNTRFGLAVPSGYPDAWTTPRHWADDAPSPFEAMRVLDPPANPRFVTRIQRHFGERFPTLEAPKVSHAWAGMIDSMPDVVPVIDEVPSLPGLVVATGMSGHGFGIGPGVGRVVADLVAGKPSGHDLRRFRFSRFSDGSKLELGPSL